MIITGTALATVAAALGVESKLEAASGGIAETIRRGLLDGSLKRPGAKLRVLSAYHSGPNGEQFEVTPEGITRLHLAKDILLAIQASLRMAPSPGTPWARGPEVEIRIISDTGEWRIDVDMDWNGGTAIEIVFLITGDVDEYIEPYLSAACSEECADDIRQELIDLFWHSFRNGDLELDISTPAAFERFPSPRRPNLHLGAMQTAGDGGLQIMGNRDAPATGRWWDYPGSMASYIVYDALMEQARAEGISPVLALFKHIDRVFTRVRNAAIGAHRGLEEWFTYHADQLASDWEKQYEAEE